ncbi:amidase domain-containing protein [Plantibacter sp. YIM 135249]|uniref:amidase domain-containing protein n=1 Tax=Plantibacter sp. YIM 135249 TaxID=3423918 RepID=UPI003D33D2A4
MTPRHSANHPSDTDSGAQRSRVSRRTIVVSALAVTGFAACVAFGVADVQRATSGASGVQRTAGASELVPPSATPAPSTDAVPAAAGTTADPAGTGITPAFDPALPEAVRTQMAYVAAHWNSYNLAHYGSLPDTDCANFASQSLLARGWTMSEDWWAEGSADDFDFSKAWVSSTYFMYYAEDHPELATALDDTQRAQVKVGDIVQFDWDRSGDRDHTGIVTAVVPTATGIDIRYAGHTDDTVDRSVDWAITEYHPGGAVYYWSIA